MDNLDGDTRTRRDALARSLCARLCDERRSLDVLEAIDAALAIFESEETPRTSLRYLLENDRYNESQGSETERAKRQGWNAAMAHATALVRAFGGLDELRRQAAWPDEEAAQ